MSGRKMNFRQCVIRDDLPVAANSVKLPRLKFWFADNKYPTFDLVLSVETIRATGGLHVDENGFVTLGSHGNAMGAVTPPVKNTPNMPQKKPIVVAPKFGTSTVVQDCTAKFDGGMWIVKLKCKNGLSTRKIVGHN